MVFTCAVCLLTLATKITRNTQLMASGELSKNNKKHMASLHIVVCCQGPAGHKTLTEGLNPSYIH